MNDQQYPTYPQGARVRVQVDFLIDPRRYLVRPGETAEAIAAGIVGELIEDCRNDVDDMRIMTSEVISGPGLTLWDQQPHLVNFVSNPDDEPYQPSPTILAGRLDAITFVDDEPEGPYVRLRDTFTGAMQGGIVGESEEQLDRFFAFTQRVAPTLLFVDEIDAADNAERTMPSALLAGVYSDQACPQCKNALTMHDANAGFRLCGYCARERQRIQGRLESLEDGTGSYVDPVGRATIELGHAYEDCTGRVAEIKRIHVDSAARGQGVASAMLDYVCDEADDNDTNLRLEVAARAGAGGLNNDQLRAWYTRHGFVPDTDNDRPGEWLIRDARVWREKKAARQD